MVVSVNGGGLIASAKPTIPMLIWFSCSALSWAAACATETSSSVLWSSLLDVVDRVAFSGVSL